MLVRDGKIESVGASGEIERKRAAQKIIDAAEELFCQDLSMRTRIWFLPEIVSTILSGALAARLTNKLPKPAAEFGQR